MTTPDSSPAPAPIEQVARSIVILRSKRLLLDVDLADLYGVPVKVLNQAVKRNRERFPEDFMIQLTCSEWAPLRSQFVTLKVTRGQHRKYLPYAFTEHGAIMAATILNSSQAIEMSVYVVRAFVKLRELLASNTELARRVDELETRIVRRFGSYDQAIADILVALRELTKLQATDESRPIGFTADIA